VVKLIKKLELLPDFLALIPFKGYLRAISIITNVFLGKLLVNGEKNMVICGFQNN